MNLVVDAGNTQIKWALFQSTDLTEQGTVKSWEELACEPWKRRVSELHGCLISSTRKIPADLDMLLSEQEIPVYHLHHLLPLPIQLAYHTPETLGLDRIAAATGALALYPDEDILIIDMGTAITFDLLTADTVFQGGNISPGMEIRFRGLNRYTDHLPLVKPGEWIDDPAKSTIDAIRSGVQSGILYEVIGYINSLKNKYNELRVILTGGDAEFFVKKLKKTIFVNPNLVLHGLNEILEYQNKAQEERL